MGPSSALRLAEKKRSSIVSALRGMAKDPEAGLTIFRGDLYGTTYGGGPYDFGTVFSVTPEGKERVLHHFGKTPDGQNPTADLVVLNGVLYGTTLSGGDDNGGTVFSITNAGKERVIHRFPYLSKDKGGFAPFGGLIAFNGALYGTTAGGGNCIGTLFKMTTDGREQVLQNFHCSLHDGTIDKQICSKPTAFSTEPQCKGVPVL